MVAICLRKYQRPRIGGYRGRGGRGRPGFVAPKQQLQYTIYRVLSSTAVQQYSSTTETAVQQPFTPHTPSGGRRIVAGAGQGKQRMAICPGGPQPRRPPYPPYPLLRGCWYLRGQMTAICSPCPAPATGLLQGLCCKGYAARAMMQPTL